MSIFNSITTIIYLKPGLHIVSLSTIYFSDIEQNINKHVNLKVARKLLGTDKRCVSTKLQDSKIFVLIVKTHLGPLK